MKKNEKSAAVATVITCLFVALVMLVPGCPRPSPVPTPEPSASVAPTASPSPTSSQAPGVVPVVPGARVSSQLTVANDTDAAVTVYVAFGANSVVLPAAWSFCSGSGLNCNFPLSAKAKQDMPLSGKYLNATFSFDQPVTCNTTKAETNLNNPSWYDVTDISLVDGFNKVVAIDVKDANGPRTLGPALPKGNEKAFGVYPNGCDICVARQNPPCGMKPGKDGCKGGTQFAPDVPCQYQGPTMSGGGAYVVRLLAGVPAK